MKLAKLGDHATFLSGFAFKSNLFNEDGIGTPIIRIRDVVRGHSETFYSGEYDERFLVTEGDYLIGMDGEFNLAKWKSEPALLNQRVCKISALSKELNRDYLARYLAVILKKIEDETPFVTVKHLSVTKLNEVPIPLPPLAVQKRIAGILDAADALRAKRREALAQLDTLLQSTFLDMFGDPVTNPKGWQLTALENLGMLDRGISRHRPRNEPSLLNGPYPLIQTGDIAKSGGYIRKYETTYSEKGLAQSKLWPKGTLCITIAANIAKTGILTFDSCFPDSVVGFVSSTYGMVEYAQGLFWFFQTILDQQATQVAQKNINLGMLRKLEVPIPPENLRSLFAAFVQSVEQQKSRMQAHLAELDALFASLQSRAFNGEL